MINKKIGCLFLATTMILFTACKREAKNVKSGKYFSKDNDTSITIYENNHIQINNLDLSELEKKPYEAFEIYHIKNNSDLSEEEKESEIKSIEEKIDLNKQYVENRSKFDLIEDFKESGQGKYVISSEVYGTELFLTAIYIPKEDTIVFDDVNYILEGKWG